MDLNTLYIAATSMLPVLQSFAGEVGKDIASNAVAIGIIGTVGYRFWLWQKRREHAAGRSLDKIRFTGHYVKDGTLETTITGRTGTINEVFDDEPHLATEFKRALKEAQDKGGTQVLRFKDKYLPDIMLVLGNHRSTGDYLHQRQAAAGLSGEFFIAVVLEADAATTQVARVIETSLEMLTGPALDADKLKYRQPKHRDRVATIAVLKRFYGELAARTDTLAYGSTPLSLHISRT
ncbi:MAG: hypothetical protein EBR79_00610 [Proteobacteria bacterium]|nr:hypothetical protein [Pseudomonadota bacterium]NBX85956.1 hypothetical protein [Pseudomonadota bacterium]